MIHRGSVMVHAVAAVCAVVLLVAVPAAAATVQPPAVFATVLDVAAWQAAVANKVAYAPPDFTQLHFIHCSTNNQTAWVLNRFYGANTTALTAVIETAELTSPVAMVHSVPGMAPFPHIMGKLNLEAVPKVLTLTRPSLSQPWNHAAVCASLGGCADK